MLSGPLILKIVTLECSINLHIGKETSGLDFNHHFFFNIFHISSGCKETYLGNQNTSGCFAENMPLEKKSVIHELLFLVTDSGDVGTQYL